MPAPETSGALAERNGAAAGPAPRVLHLRSSCGFYGAEGVIYNLVRSYPGETVTACLADTRAPHTELADRLAGEGRATAAVRSAGAVDPAVPFRLAGLIRRVRPDVVHTHDYKSDALAFLAARCLPGTPAPLVATMHGVVRTTGALRRYERLDARLLRRFEAVAAVSAGTAAIARDEYGVPADRITVIANGVDTDAFRPDPDRAAARSLLGIPPDGALVGVVGRLSEEKGQNVLLAAMASDGLSGRVRVALVGDGPMEAPLREEAAAMGLADRVHFLGRREDMARVYPAFDVLALPSLTEGLPLTVLEASACGVPVVASDVGDVAQAIPDGSAGLLVPPGDADALAGALARLVSEPALAGTLAAAARLRVEERFSARAMALGYETLYRAARAHRRGRS